MVHGFAGSRATGCMRGASRPAAEACRKVAQQENKIYGRHGKRRRSSHCCRNPEGGDNRHHAIHISVCPGPVVEGPRCLVDGKSFNIELNCNLVELLPAVLTAWVWLQAAEEERSRLGSSQREAIGAAAAVEVVESLFAKLALPTASTASQLGNGHA